MARILFITEKYPPAVGGVAVSAARISATLGRIGHEVHVLALSRTQDAGTVVRENPSAGVVVHRFGESRNIDFTMQQATNFLEWLHQRVKFDLVWGHYVASAGFLAAWFARLNGVKSVMAIRGNDFDRQIFPPGDLARLQWCLGNCSEIVTVSADLARKVSAFSGRKSRVLPNVVDTGLFRPGEARNDLKEQYGISPDELVLLFSGELRAKKGLKFLMQAFRDTLVRRPARLLVVGEVRGRDLGEFERHLADDTDAAAHVTVTGALSDAQDVAHHLQLADVCLVPSLWDGLPNSLLEAMASGVPVVASDAGAIPELITDGVSGWLVPKTHLHQLADRIDAVMAMPGARRQTIVDAAREHVCRYYSPAVEESNLRQLLDDVAGAEVD